MELHLCNKNGDRTFPPDSGEPTSAGDSPFSGDDFDSACSTPYVSAPSSPGRAQINGGGFFYSCPASPMHFAITATYSASAVSSPDRAADFDFSARFGLAGSGQTSSMSSADELFLNGQIRPMKLSSHLERPQLLAPLLDLNEEEDEDNDNGGRIRGRDLRLRDKSVRRRARSMSPMRSNPFDFADEEEVKEKTQSQICLENEKLEVLEGEVTIPLSDSASSSRSSSAGRNSKRWVFLKDFLNRSKSEGRSSNKFWSSISFSPAKEKKSTQKEKISSVDSNSNQKSQSNQPNSAAKKPVNGVGKRRITTSPHELHYKASKAQAEEMKKKTYLPYRRGLIGCLGFSSKGYGAINGFARALNPVSSR